MNRRQRRAAVEPTGGQRIRALQRCVEQTGQPGHVYGLTGGCVDCTADGALTLLPGAVIIAHVFHDEHCPAAAGVIPWRPEPIDEGHAS